MAACTSDEATDYTYLFLEINPTMEMIINQDGNVVSYNLRNEAAEIVAAGLELEGMNYEEALHLYLNAAVQTGYIDVERNDNALAIQACNENEDDADQFQVQVQSMLQTYMAENKLGAVVLNQGEVNEAVLALVDEYDITFGNAKLIDAYLSIDETNTIEDALAMTNAELIDALVGLQESKMLTFRNQRQVGAQAIKDELADALQSKVQAHLDAVAAGTAEQPDTTGVEAAYLNDYEGLKEAFVIRNEERVEYAYAVMNGEVAQYLVGTYQFENSDETLPYAITYHNYELLGDGTYTESYSWTITGQIQVQTGENTGTWVVVDGALVLTNQAQETIEFQLLGNRIVFENQDGIEITFRRQISTD